MFVETVEWLTHLAIHFYIFYNFYNFYIPMPTPIRFKRLRPDISVPEYKTPGAVAFDLAVCEGGRLEPGERRIFPTGLVVCVPEGHALLLFARSSNTKKGIQMANGVGVIDQDYCGPDDELHLALYNIGSEPYEIQPGERIAQGIFVPIAVAVFEEVQELTAPDRGGFGTTG